MRSSFFLRSLNARRLVVMAAFGLGPLALASAAHTENRLKPRDAATDASAPHDAGTKGDASDGGYIFSLSKDQPDPTPLVSKDKWLFDLRYQRGDVFLLGTHPLERNAPSATPRAFGRFALELFEGPALVERVRFDFPLLGVETPKDAPDLSAKLVSRIGVVFPKTDRGTRLELHDRATGKRYPMPWPPPDTK